MKAVITENDVSGASMDIYFAKNHIGESRDFKSFARYHDVVAFAKHVKQVFKSNCPSAVCTPVLRVDIFQSQCNKLVLNELENLDAFTEKSGQVDINNKRPHNDTDVRLTAFRSNFFTDKLKQLVDKSLTTIV